MPDEKDGGPAFPAAGSDINEVEWGISLRDWFAGRAPPMTDQWWEDSKGDSIHYADAQAAWAFFYADAMIKERLK